MKAKKITALVLAIAIVLCFSGCRQRTTYSRTNTKNIDNGQQDDSQKQTRQEADNSAPPEKSQKVVPETHIEASTSGDAPDTIEVHAGEANRDASAGSQSGEGRNKARDAGTDTVTLTQATDEGGQTKPSGEGGSIEMIMDKYADFLKDGVGSLYPCQVCYIYVEGEEDYRTFSRGSEEHQLVMQSGCYNIAEKLGTNTLIDDRWIIKKNPELIVKFVSADVLGNKAENTDAAKKICSAIRTRSGWDTTRAVINGQILILSKELLDSDKGKLVAKLYIASTLYPSLFSSLNLNTMCHELLGDSGIYAYCSK